MPRAIHCSSKHPFSPGMRWLSQELGKSLHHPHLLRDTRDLIACLSRCPIPDDHVLVKIDIKDFFMSGHLMDLVHICSQYFAPDLKEAGCEMLRCILFNQFIGIPGYDDTWCTVQGSGMGLIPSGDVSDLCFYDMVVKYLLEPSTISDYSISMYARYKDDAILALGGSRSTRLRLFNLIKSKSRFFRLNFESISSHQAQMLDLTVFKGQRWRKTRLLDFECYSKPTSQKVPLSWRSGHPMHVHLSWPLSQLARFDRNCSNRANAFKHKAKFCAELLSSNGFDLNPNNQLTCSMNCSVGNGPRLILPFRPD